MFRILIAVVVIAAPSSLWALQEVARVEEGERKKDTPLAVNPRLVLDVQPLTEAIRIDGVIEPAWMEASRFENFTEIWPSENIAARVRTEGYVAMDGDYLYFAFVCHDPDIRRLRAHVTDRDRIFQDDFVGIMLDTYRNEQTAYELFVNPYGIQGDLLRGIDGQEDETFDMVWSSEARIYEDRWVVEVAIPFKSLRFPRTEEQSWSMHILRIYPRESRFQLSWMPVSQDNNSLFSQAGTLRFRNGSHRTAGVELLPYTIGSRLREITEGDDDNGRRAPADWSGDVGFNVKYGLASNMTLDFAYNPDFSQIEADAGQINVNNTFALYYREKRPFFLEGSDIFAVDRSLNLLYTRSVNDPLLASKLTGKTGRTTIGFISAYDQGSPYLLPFEEQSIALSTSKNSYTHILRVKYDVGSRSYIGMAASDRRLDGRRGSNTAAAVNANIRLSEKYSVSALAGLSTTREPVDSSLSADEIDELDFRANGHRYTSAFDGENFSGWALRASFERSARHWNLSSYYEDASPAFRAENSFIRSNNYRVLGAWTGYMFRLNEHPVFYQVEPGLEFARKYNYDGTLKDNWARAALWLGFQKQTGVHMSVAFLNNEQFGGKQFNRMNRASLNFNSNAFNAVSGGFFVEAGKYLNRLGDEGDPRNPFEIAKGLSVEVWATFKPTSRLSDQVSAVSFELWDHFGGRTIRRQRILRNTLSYQFTRRLFLRLIGEINRADVFYTDSDDDGNFFFDANGEPIVAHERATSFSVDPLMSYKINPFTVFYLGAHWGGERDPYPNYDGLTVTDQSVFVKFQYFLRL